MATKRKPIVRLANVSAECFNFRDSLLHRKLRDVTRPLRLLGFGVVGTHYRWEFFEILPNCPSGRWGEIKQTPPKNRYKQI
mmetsp:Transcript_31954/g.39369  ORF Transcript_31954/g.39369 Transcript_31954/m.39369 type:complete len:81 (+) Transcript_31954:330-572(+)